jgi:hypothetical protein
MLMSPPMVATFTPGTLTLTLLARSHMRSGLFRDTPRLSIKDFAINHKTHLLAQDGVRYQDG